MISAKNRAVRRANLLLVHKKVDKSTVMCYYVEVDSSTNVWRWFYDSEI